MLRAPRVTSPRPLGADMQSILDLILQCLKALFKTLAVCENATEFIQTNIAGSKARC